MRDNDNDETSKVKLGQEQAADGTSKPVVYVLMPDGETTTFKDRALLLPGAGPEPVGDVYAVLINANGEQLNDASTGEPAVVPVPPMMLRRDPEHMVSQREAAERLGVHRATIERAVKKGELVKHHVGGRHPRIRKADLDSWAQGKLYAAKK